MWFRPIRKRSSSAASIPYTARTSNPRRIPPETPLATSCSEGNQMTHSNSFLRGCAALAGLVLTACAITPNGPEDGLSVEQRFPITVEPHMEGLRLAFNPASGGLDQAGSADLERFARDYMDNG